FYPYMLNWVQIRRIWRVLYDINIVGLQPIHNTISLVNRGIILLKKEIMNTTGNHLMNNRNKIPSQESHISSFVNSSGNRNQRSPSLAPKTTPYHERDTLILLFRIDTVCMPSLSRFSKNPLLPWILRFFYTAFITPNHSLKIFFCPVLMSYCPLESLSNMFWLQLWS